MGADQFLLTWNNHRANLAEVFTQLRVQDQLVDVTLLCDGGSYPAHRLVLAACSPYFHQLFTKLPTQHPLVYLKDVRQTELEALLEFIYRGEVSVANSELSGLIKIAESLRIKGLGDVSQRDPTPIVSTPKAEKRSSTGSSFSNLPSGRPKKTQRLVNVNGSSKSPVCDTELPSVVPPPTGFGFGAKSLMTSLDNNAASSVDGDQDSRDSATPPFAAESKLRSRLEVQEPPLGLPFSNLLSQVPATSRLGTLLRRDADLRKSRIKLNPLDEVEPEKEEKTLLEDVKQEALYGEEMSNPMQNEPEVMMPQFPKLYDTGDFGNSFLTKYTQLLSSFHHHQQQQLHLQHQTAAEDEPSTPSGFTSLIPTTVQDQQPSLSPKDVKSLRCHLCGATIKHIANFRRHMKQHLNPRRFPCPWCSAAFGRKDNLKTHTRKHHPVEVEAQEQATTSSGPSLAVPLESDRDDDGGDGGQLFNGLAIEGRSEDTEEDDSLIIAEEKEDVDGSPKGKEDDPSGRFEEDECAAELEQEGNEGAHS